MILINRSLNGYQAGTVVQFATSSEGAQVAQGFGSVSAGPVTPGPVSVIGVQQGRCAAAAAASSITINHTGVTAETRIVAFIAQAVADTTATNVVRIVPAVGSFTLYLNAATTAATTIDWAILTPVGDTATN